MSPLKENVELGETRKQENFVTTTKAWLVKIAIIALRDWLLHRAVVADRFRSNQISVGVVPAELPKDWQVHHQVGKLNFEP
jgi:hypothetical protein